MKVLTPFPKNKILPYWFHKQISQINWSCSIENCQKLSMYLYYFAFFSEKGLVLHLYKSILYRDALGRSWWKLFQRFLGEKLKDKLSMYFWFFNYLPMTEMSVALEGALPPKAVLGQIWSKCLVELTLNPTKTCKRNTKFLYVRGNLLWIPLETCKRNTKFL